MCTSNPLRRRCWASGALAQLPLICSLTPLQSLPGPWPRWVGTHRYGLSLQVVKAKGAGEK